MFFDNLSQIKEFFQAIDIKLCHSRSQLPATSGSSRLPLKKRKYVADSEGPEPIAKVSKQISSYDQQLSQSQIKGQPMAPNGRRIIRQSTGSKQVDRKTSQHD